MVRCSESLLYGHFRTFVRFRKEPESGHLALDHTSRTELRKCGCVIFLPCVDIRAPTILPTWFESEEDLVQAMGSREGQKLSAALLEDEGNFINHSESSSFIVREHQL